MPAKKTTILTADDDPQILRLIVRNLELDGYEVIAVSDGQAALEQIEAHAPDLVLLDIMMPRMDGFTVTQRVREFSAVPIMLLTARGQDQDKIRGLDLGADDYLTKPFSVEELLARVRAVLRRSQFAADAHGLSATTTVGEMTIDYTQHLVTLRGRRVLNDRRPSEFDDACEARRARREPMHAATPTRPLPAAVGAQRAAESPEPAFHRAWHAAGRR
jgi:DNA-binding response OmpR family regulator